MKQSMHKAFNWALYHVWFQTKFELKIQKYLKFLIYYNALEILNGKNNLCI